MVLPPGPMVLSSLWPMVLPSLWHNGPIVTPWPKWSYHHSGQWPYHHSDTMVLSSHWPNGPIVTPWPNGPTVTPWSNGPIIAPWPNGPINAPRAQWTTCRHYLTQTDHPPIHCGYRRPLCLSIVTRPDHRTTCRHPPGPPDHLSSPARTTGRHPPGPPDHRSSPAARLGRPPSPVDRSSPGGRVTCRVTRRVTCRHLPVSAGPLYAASSFCLAAPPPPPSRAGRAAPRGAAGRSRACGGRPGRWSPATACSPPATWTRRPGSCPASAAAGRCRGRGRCRGGMEEWVERRAWI